MMNLHSFILISICAVVMVGTKAKAQCPKVTGTVQISDSFSVNATEITVCDYTSFIVASNYDTTLFPKAAVLQTLVYRELFADLRNKQHDRFLQAKGKGAYTFYFEKVKGTREEKKKLKEWLQLPISGISRNQAEEYCKWLQHHYNLLADGHKRSCYYEIRLPTAEELNIALQQKGVLTNKIAGSESTFRFVAFIHKR
jgi:formylglycine-generating enzyme required for sulfatase activity